MAGDVTIECERESCIYNKGRKLYCNPVFSTGSSVGSQVRGCINKTLFMDAEGRCRCFVDRGSGAASYSDDEEEVDHISWPTNVEQRVEARDDEDSSDDVHSSERGEGGTEHDAKFGKDDGLRLIAPDEGIRLFRRKRA